MGERKTGHSNSDVHSEVPSGGGYWFPSIHGL